MKSYIRICRGILDHPVFKQEPYTEREAWIWMLLEAAWKDRTIDGPKGKITVGRGQLSYSSRYLAKKWQWSAAHVRRFLTRLKSDAMIDPASDAASDAGQFFITICNYDEYQSNNHQSDAPTDPASDPQSDPKHKEGLKEINTKKGLDLFDDVDPDEDPRAVTFRLGRTILAKYEIGGDKAGALMGRWLKFVGNDDVLMQQILRSADSAPRGEIVSYIEGAIRRQTKPVDHDRSRRLVDRMHKLQDLGKDVAWIERKAPRLGDMTDPEFSKLLSDVRSEAPGST